MATELAKSACEPLTCARCGYMTLYKTSMRRHLKRSTACRPLLCDLTREEVNAEFFGAIDSKERAFGCGQCGKRFTTKYSLAAHRRSVSACRVRRDGEDGAGIERELAEVKGMLAAFIAQQHRETGVAQQHRETGVAQQHRETEGQVAAVHGSNNVIHVQQSATHHTTNNTTTHVTINAFGRERVDHLTQEFLDTCVRRRDKGLVELLERIHFDQDHADNNNLRVTNIKSSLIQCHTGVKWAFDKKDRVLDRLVDTGHGIMQHHYDGHEDRLRESMSLTMFNCIRKWIDDVADRDKDTMEGLLMDIYLLILNSSSAGH